MDHPLNSLKLCLGLFLLHIFSTLSVSIAANHLRLVPICSPCAVIPTVAHDGAIWIDGPICSVPLRQLDVIVN